MSHLPLHRTRQASALLLVLWSLILLSGAIFAWGAWIHQDIAMHAGANRDVEARAMASSGVAVALHPQVTKLTPILQEEIVPGMGYTVKMISEGGKLNLRWWLEGEDPRKLTILSQWLEQHGLSFQEREVFLDSLLDWIDPDDVHRMNGVEVDGDYRAPNRPLQTIEELEKIRGSEPLLASPGWKDQLTLYSQGPLDLNAAEPELLRLLPGFSEPRINALLATRRGQDGEDNTEDDQPFQNVDQAMRVMGFSQAQQQSIAGLVIVNDRTTRIISKGISGKVIRQIEVVAVKTGGNPVIRYWQE